ncbi:MAG: ribosome small subunit-dependent GTPase A [Pseudopedobacter saltans]|uniref:Small ribosomal subunit biogenesis GTPase RsgA n=1 Tax=Pseudopedobacter saltans TaxID=151895 RepID=A0A2W5FAM8_9SPHI|nr:MAG: ribosome small subunit-dependent GTPase A [Pseudopedobacter saltans]
MIATIYKSTGSWYVAKAENGIFYNTRIKGKFKIEGLTTTNPIAVGDVVDIELEEGEEKVATIIHIHDRKNYIVRTSAHNRNQRHIVAANLDQALLFVGLRDPKTSTGFMDRFLAAAEAWHVPTNLIVNKSDTFRDKEWAIFEKIKIVYEPLGYGVFPLSLETKEGLTEVMATLSDKTTLISGQSGIGKSTFINGVLPDENIRTQEVSAWSGKGLHTTTFAQMYDLKTGNGRIIDTPGIREFGITNDIEAAELSHYFPEMRARIHDCRFNNCLHVNEPGCAVKDAVENSEIALDRYMSYLNILDSLPKKNY